MPGEETTAAASREMGATGACVAARYIRLVCAAKRSGLEAEPFVVRRHARRAATPSLLHYFYYTPCTT